MKTLHKIFPTYIAQFNDKEFTTKVLPIANKFLSEAKEYGDWKYKTSYGDREVIKALGSNPLIFNTLKSYCAKFFTATDQRFIFKNTNNLFFECFVSEIKPGTSHGPHQHPFSILSGVCYLEIPKENGPPIIFHDPRQVRFHQNIKPYPNMYDGNSLSALAHQINPEEGDIIIWESWLSHEVLTNRTTDLRKTLVFNLFYDS